MYFVSYFQYLYTLFENPIISICKHIFTQMEIYMGRFQTVPNTWFCFRWEILPYKEYSQFISWFEIMEHFLIVEVSRELISILVKRILLYPKKNECVLHWKGLWKIVFSGIRFFVCLLSETLKKSFVHVHESRQPNSQ